MTDSDEPFCYLYLKIPCSSTADAVKVVESIIGEKGGPPGVHQNHIKEIRIERVK